MGMFDWLINIHHLALGVFLGFATVAFVCLAFLAGRSRQDYYDADHPWGPLENYADWARAGHAPVPLFLRFWIVAIVATCVILTAVVIHHGYYY